MGLVRNQVKWSCLKCGTTHRSNPSECRNCGHTVLQQKRRGKQTDTRTGTTTRVLSSSGFSEPDRTWYCDRCKRTHDSEPEKCKVCGRTEFILVEEEPDTPEPIPAPSDEDLTMTTADDKESSGVISGGAILKLFLFVSIAWVFVWILL